MSKYLHIYGQKSWHDEVCIAGNMEALIALRDAINKTLIEKTTAILLYVADGEEFELNVDLIDDFDLLPLPYTDPIARNSKDNPWQPITTAPKHRNILVFYRYHIPTKLDICKQVVVHWCDRDPQFPWKYVDEELFLNKDYVTHWMDLPSSPQ